MSTSYPWNFKNFSLTELVKSQTALRKNIDNYPTDEAEANLHYLVETFLQPLRTALGRPITINSGYRSPELNTAIGGSTTSQHCKGEAIDLECPGMTTAELCLRIAEDWEYDQMILEYYKPGIPNSGWVHLSFKREGNRKQLLIKEKGKNYCNISIKDLERIVEAR